MPRQRVYKPKGDVSLQAVHQDGAAFVCESCGQAVEVHPTAALQSIRSQADDLPGVKVARKGPGNMHPPQNQTTDDCLILLFQP